MRNKCLISVIRPSQPAEWGSGQNRMLSPISTISNSRLCTEPDSYSRSFTSGPSCGYGNPYWDGTPTLGGRPSLTTISAIAQAPNVAPTQNVNGAPNCSQTMPASALAANRANPQARLKIRMQSRAGLLVRRRRSWLPASPGSSPCAAPTRQPLTAQCSSDY